jgi:hypothetical protein
MVHDSQFPLQHNAVVLYDPEIGKYIAYTQHSHHWHWLNPRRQIGCQESDNLIDWGPKEIVMTAEDSGTMDPAIEFHTACVYKVDSLYISLVEVAKVDPLWQVRDHRNWKDYFYVQTCLAISRNGKKWSLLHDVEDPWLANGPWGSQDAGIIAFQNKPITRDGKLMFYYTALSHKQGLNKFTGLEREDIAVPKPLLTDTFYEINMESHDVINNTRAIAHSSLREDGYVGVKPNYEEGHVLTTQFVFEGNKLLMNADVSFGYAKVQILDPRMEPYEGFSLEDCDKIHGKEVWNEVKWNGNSDVSCLWNKPVRLKIYLQNSTLYSFKFSE